MAQLAAELDIYTTHGELEQQLGILLEEPEHLVLVATDTEESDEPVGWLHAHVVMGIAVPTSVEVSALIVKTRWRHHGGDRQLIKEAMAWSQQQGIDVFRTLSNDTSEDVQNFYNDQGLMLVAQQNVFEVSLSEK
ncbi:GNAT family N-acetyltransferase [Phytohalomonas tamaricis]|uniref:GNAT family N-acetyltransferase n=1 Tax=Phytohalomonas tamaricis TaxID=2081032 RepID=UPI000D0B7F46|nr:GNAT family N-acetyltransferase [Phytohalomonas tamaricis]